MNDSTRKLIILGSGPAGLTAGIYAARANLQPIIFEGSTPGGQLMSTSYVDNWPGEKHILGPTLMSNMREHAKETGCTIISQTVTCVDFSKKPFIITTKEDSYTAHAVILAMGATPKRLQCPGEDDYWGKGVTSCAVCDGPLYKDKKVVIVGGGDTAMEDASFMTCYTNDITIIHIQDRLTASAAMQKPILQNKQIKIIYSSTVTSIQGNKSHITEISVTNQKTHETTPLKTDVLFVAIGLTPNTSILKQSIRLNNYGYIQIEKNTNTSIPGIFAAGDIADDRYRQAITSAGTGCMAALDAERYLKDLSL